ncbi:MAG: sugar phosphate isomerase/epimerase family protein [Planctomycetota bacterium]|jgi:sugar phosphate isomerase/epimerase
MITRKIIRLLLLVTVTVFIGSCGSSQNLAKDEPSRDWRIAVQAYTFKKFTFFEAVEKTSSLGLHYIDAWRKQKISDDIDIKFIDMSPHIRGQVRAKLAEAGVRLLNYGVVPLPNDEIECRQVFDFARDLGAETIISEPPTEALDLIERLCKEYQIPVAIHNHPTPKLYWNPDTVLEACKGRSKWIGVCADTGHWMRSGINPVEALKKLEGRILVVHLKDLNEFGIRQAHDVPWGTGKADIKAILTELDRQDFNGVFTIEYEYNWENSVPEISKCIKYFKKTSRQLNREVK